MNQKYMWMILIATFIVVGCGATHTVQQTYVPDEQEVAFQKMIVTLQELGWTITATDKETGVISAEKAERRKRKPEYQASILIFPKKEGSEVRVSVTKAGRGARMKVKRQADEILDRYASK